MPNLYVTMDGDGVGQLVGRARLADDPEELKKISQRIESGNELIAAFAQRAGGSVIQAGGDESCIQIPPDKLNELPAIREQYHQITGATLSAGVGFKLSESSKALLCAKLEGKDRIKLYDEGCEQLIAKFQQNQPDEKEKLFEEYIKTENSNDLEPLADSEAMDTQQKDLQKNQPAHNVPSPHVPTQSDHEEIQVARDVADQAQSPEMTHAADGFEGQLHQYAQAQEESDKKELANKSNNLDQVKAQLVQAMQAIKQQAPVMEQLKQSSPQTYQAMLAMTASVIELARNMSQPLNKAEGYGPVQHPLDKLTGVVANVVGNDPSQPNTYRSYVGSEAMYHLLGGEGSGWGPVHVKHDGIGHWFLKHKTGKVLDVIPSQMGPNVPYDFGRPKRFMTKSPSKQAMDIIGQVLGHGINKEEMKTEASPEAPYDENNPKLDKAALPMPNPGSSKHSLHLPVGAVKGDKVKVRHEDGSDGWVEVSAGQIRSQDPGMDGDPHPVSSLRPSGR